MTLRCLDLFCGCGGFSHGFQTAGFEIKYGIDIGYGSAIQKEILEACKNLKALENPTLEDLEQLEILEEEIDHCKQYSSAVERTFVKNHQNAIFISSDIRDLDPRDYADVDVIIGSPPCLVADEEILTPEGKKKIQDIKIGDLVLTHEGRYKRVTNTNKRAYDGYINKIYINYYPFPLICTDEHPIFVKKRTKRWNNKRRDYDRGYTKQMFVPASEVTADHFIGFPVNQEEVMFERPKIKRVINQHDHVWESSNLPFDDPKFWFFIGFYIAEGWYRDDRNTVTISVNDDEIEMIKKLIQRIGLKISAVGNVKGRSSKIHIQDLHLWNFVKIFNKGATDKNIPHFIEDLPKKFLKSLLLGWLFGDGYFDKNAKTYRGSSSSLELLEGFQRIGIKVYDYIPSLFMGRTKRKHKIENRIVNCNAEYALYFNNRKRWNCNTRNHIFSKIKRIEKVQVKNVLVYNLKIEEDESFCKHLFATHNCPNFSVAKSNPDPTKGMVLVNVFRKWIEVIKPKWWIMENVVGIKDHLDTFYPVKKELNCANYGVPQVRKRYFAGKFKTPDITHTRSGKQRTLFGGQLKKWVTVKEAIGDIMEIMNHNVVLKNHHASIKCSPSDTGSVSRNSPYQEIDRPSRTIRSFTPPELVPREEMIMYNEQKNRIKNLDAINSSQKSMQNTLNSDFGMFKRNNRFDLNKPSFTIRAESHGNVPIVEIDPSAIVEYKGETYTREPLDQVMKKPSQTIDCDGYLRGGKRVRDENGTAPTLPTGLRRYRKLTVRECARLQSFPDTFEFKGSVSACYRMIGNAVPPLMAQRLAEALM